MSAPIPNRGTRITRVATLSLAILMLTGTAQALTPLFTYQGQLQVDGIAVNGTCDLRVGLFPAEEGGEQVGNSETRCGVEVSNGLFTIDLNENGALGADAFNGDNRFLSIEVRCPAVENCPDDTSGYTALTPREQITAAPYALVSQSDFAIGGSITNPSAFNANANHTIAHITFSAPADGLAVVSWRVTVGLNGPASVECQLLVGAYSTPKNPAFGDAYVSHEFRPPDSYVQFQQIPMNGQALFSVTRGTNTAYLQGNVSCANHYWRFPNMIIRFVPSGQDDALQFN